ncbi:MAG: hydrogenase maturation protease [Actinobacteria bacterium]|nr:hydrogenase maturation protease [Actinomycetota bacterium]
MSALVICVGNPYRHDDGVGVRAYELLQQAELAGVSVVEETGESTGLVARWAGHDEVILVDAGHADSPPGTIHRLEFGDGRWQAPALPGNASTHGLGVAEAMQLGEVLDQLPQRLVLFAVETADTSSGVGLSPEVEAALPDLVTAVISELDVAAPQPAH